MHRAYFVLVTMALLACVDREPDMPLINAQGSAQALGSAVLEALGDGDRGRLEALALSEQEFRVHVWPELPAANPERNLPFSYVWGDLHQKSQLGLQSTLKARSGRRYTLERVTFAGETPYPTYRVHRDATFHVRDTSGGETEIRVCGSMLEKNGGWKVFSYVVD